MKTLNFLFVFSLIALAWACKPDKKVESSTVTEIPAKTEENTLNPEKNHGEVLLEKCIDAHGGMDRWNSFVSLEYNLDDNGKMVHQITQLNDRRAYIKSKEYEVGFDGEVAWALPSAEKVSGGSAAFYYDLDFYFIGIPFVLQDNGVHVTYKGKANVDGKPYESLKITFGKDVGLTPEDVYYLYIDPESYTLRILTYSISYFDRKSAEINSAKVYSDYREVQEIMMPHRMENFEWDADAEEIGKSKEHIRLFSDLKFSKEVSDETIFEVPDGAVTEKVK